MNAKTKLYDAPTAELVVVRMEHNLLASGETMQLITDEGDWDD